MKWIVGQGSFFGENAVIGNKMRITTAKAVEWCNIYYITLDDIEDTIRKYSRAAISFKVYKSNMRTEANARLQKVKKTNPVIPIKRQCSCTQCDVACGVVLCCEFSGILLTRCASVGHLQIKRAALMIGKKKPSMVHSSALVEPPSSTPDVEKPASVQKEESGVGEAYEGDVIALDLNPAAMSMDSPEPATPASKDDRESPSRKEGAGEQPNGNGKAKSEIQARLFLVPFLLLLRQNFAACGFQELSFPKLS